MAKVKPIYLDYNATTPCAAEVIEAMLPFFSGDFGNPASPHAMGRVAAEAVEAARVRVAALVECAPDEIIFTSGATESNNIVLLGIVSQPRTRRKIAISAVEHKSVLEPCARLAQRGFAVITLPVDGHGIVDLDEASRLIDDDTLLVSVQGANNETGTVQPVTEIARIAHTHGALMHSDCAQMLGKVPVSVFDLGVDYASFSGHKVYGPKGIGFLFFGGGRCRSQLDSICFGGGQETGLRPGTLNVPGIVGFGEACRLARERLPKDMHGIDALRHRFELAITQALPSAHINGSEVDRLPGTTSLTLPGLPASMLIANVPHLCIGEGSACSSGAPEPSHVLLAMGLSREDAESTVRFSLGRGNSVVDVDEAACSVERETKRLLSAMCRTTIPDSSLTGERE